MHRLVKEWLAKDHNVFCTETIQAKNKWANRNLSFEEGTAMVLEKLISSINAEGRKVISIHWMNIADSQENPLGEIGFYAVKCSAHKPQGNVGNEKYKEAFNDAFNEGWNKGHRDGYADAVKDYERDPRVARIKAGLE